jgi:putative tricarboxylic transport membrane protein
MVGAQTVTGVTRFTFDTAYLREGIPLVPLMLGLFGLPAAMELAVSGGSISKSGETVRGMGDLWEGAKDVFRHWGLWIRSSLIGYIVGIIPGIGASTAVFIAYGQAKMTSKHPEEFGKGCVEGVIAPETATNAKEAGALLTTVALGVPGSTSMAVLLAGLLIIGVTPGPSMLRDHMDLALILFLTIVVSHVVGIAIILACVRYIVKIAYVPGKIIFPLIVAIAFAGSYIYRGQLLDILMLIIFAALGILMKKWDYNIPALLLGFILGELFEKYIYISLNAYGPLFFMRPISLALIALTIALFVYSPIKSLFQRKKGSAV